MRSMSFVIAGGVDTVVTVTEDVGRLRFELTPTEDGIGEAQTLNFGPVEGETLETTFGGGTDRAVFDEPVALMSRASGKLESLTERELDILNLLASGFANKVIAYELGIAEATVKAHLKSMLRKLGFANRTQAAVWAVQNNFPVARHHEPAVGRA